MPDDTPTKKPSTFDEPTDFIDPDALKREAETIRSEAAFGSTQDDSTVFMSDDQLEDEADAIRGERAFQNEESTVFMSEDELLDEAEIIREQMEKGSKKDA